MMIAKRRLPRKLGCVAALGAAASACAPTPRLQIAPEVLSTEWRAGPTAQSVAAPLPDNLGVALASPELEGLLARALAANADLGVSTARIAQARAQLRLARAEMLPVVSASAGLAGSRAGGGGVKPFDFNEGYAGLDVAFEIDLFGRLGAGKRSTRARYMAASLDRQALALIVQGDVARVFVQHAALSQRLGLLDRNIGQARELLRIIEVRHRLGEATRVDTGLQTIQLRQLEVERERLLEARSRTVNALAVLVGEEAPLFVMPEAELSALKVPTLAPSQPADLLVRRPDILAAEARISAARGDIQQARAAFLPRLRLSASGIAESGTLGGPLGTVITAGLGLLAPIFDRARLRGNLDMASAVQVESVELYRKALLTALGEAEDALEAVERSRAREALLDTIVSEAVTTARLARLQYVEGAADLQWVLDAEQRLVQAQDARAIAQQERLEAAIDLYRALGGAPAAPALRLTAQHYPDQSEPADHASPAR
ncbi:MAG TPA: efflux transporter outer membrane subunit [Allosphingosinicella sp.]|jgi:NodT family efflux transporter outer membrane factor (OMF) lipoprotein